jgi:hypothetical protein
MSPTIFKIPGPYPDIEPGVAQTRRPCFAPKYDVGFLEGFISEFSDFILTAAG